MISILFELILKVNQNIKPQKCYDDIEKFLKITKSIYWAPKIDGIRCWVVKKNNNIKYYSFNGKEIFNFHCFDEEVNKLISNQDNIILDTEVTSKDKHIRGVMTQFRRLENVDPSNFRMYVFDIAKDNIKFSERLSNLKNLFRNKNLNKIYFLEYKLLLNPTIELISKMVDDNAKDNIEGIVLYDGDSNYIHTRTIHCCKCPKKKTIDLKIVDINIGKEGKYKDKVSTFVCEYKNQKLNLDGRFNLEDRQYYKDNPPINKYAEVEFTEETRDNKLRHPKITRIREDKS